MPIPSSSSISSMAASFLIRGFLLPRKIRSSFLHLLPYPLPHPPHLFLVQRPPPLHPRTRRHPLPPSSIRAYRHRLEVINGSGDPSSLNRPISLAAPLTGLSSHLHLDWKYGPPIQVFCVATQIEFWCRRHSPQVLLQNPRVAEQKKTMVGCPAVTRGTTTCPELAYAGNRVDIGVLVRAGRESHEGCGDREREMGSQSKERDGEKVTVAMGGVKEVEKEDRDIVVQIYP